MVVSRASRSGVSHGAWKADRISDGPWGSVSLWKQPRRGGPAMFNTGSDRFPRDVSGEGRDRALGTQIAPVRPTSQAVRRVSDRPVQGVDSVALRLRRVRFRSRSVECVLPLERGSAQRRGRCPGRVAPRHRCCGHIASGWVQRSAACGFLTPFNGQRLRRCRKGWRRAGASLQCRYNWRIEGKDRSVLGMID